MSDPILIVIISGIPATLAAVGSFINVYMHNRTMTKINQLEHNTNSKLDDLMKTSGQLEYRKGKTGDTSRFPEDSVNSEKKLGE